jgi:thiamine kinase-like enzyme
MNHDVKYLGKLTGGFSNATKLKFTVDGEEVLVRDLPPEKIPARNRRAEIANTRKAGEFNYGPQVYYSDLDDGDTEYVSEFIDGRVINISDIYKSDSLFEIAKILKSLHGKPLNDGFVSSKAPFQRIEENLADAAKVQGLIPDCIKKAYDDLRKMRQQYLSSAADLCNCHHDIQFDNIMLRKSGHLVLIDWEFSGEGNKFDDLGMSIIQLGLNAEKMSQFLDCYFGRVVSSEEISKIKVGILNQYLLTCSWALSTVYKICSAVGITEYSFDVLSYECEYKSSEEFLGAYMSGKVQLGYEIDAWLKLAKVCLSDFNKILVELTNRVHPEEDRSVLQEAKYSPRLFHSTMKVIMDEKSQMGQSSSASDQLKF